MSEQGVKEEVLYALNLEAHAMGLHYLGEDPQELAQIISNARRAREGLPPCYRRSFGPADKLCRRCDLYDKCGEQTIFPEFALAGDEIEPCDWCDGDLVILLYDETGTVRDRACSTPGCRRTLEKARKDAK
jgi:hypothetical protein